MNLDKFDDSSVDKKSPKKKSFDFQEFINSFNSLDPQNMGNWPAAVKITIYIFIILATLAAAYFALIRPMLEDINNARAQEQSLLNEYKEKDSKLRNLKLYQIQVEEMEQTFGELLQQLPKETEIPGLVEDINFTGVSSGLRFNNIKVQPEIKQEFFIELPISIEAQGDYHSFGAFTSGLAALPRIVTLHDFTIETLSANKVKSEIPVLKMNVDAKTYRYNDEVPADANKPAEGAQP
jgi:type IV pilus assembly protein PilO